MTTHDAELKQGARSPSRPFLPNPSYAACRFGGYPRPWLCQYIQASWAVLGGQHDTQAVYVTWGSNAGEGIFPESIYRIPERLKSNGGFQHALGRCNCSDSATGECCELLYFGPLRFVWFKTAAPTWVSWLPQLIYGTTQCGGWVFPSSFS